MARSPELQRFYASARWRNLRMLLITQRFGKCDRCGRDFSDDTSKLIAHHKIHLTDETLKDPAVAVDPKNIEIVCQQCHEYCHPENGFIKRQRQVFIIYGSPFSGKTTYVKENMEEGDLVVDLDAIYTAISLQPLYHHSDLLQKTAFGIRDYLYDHIRIRAGSWRTAWVIAGLPRKDERERLAARLGGSLVLVESTEQECIKRCVDADDGRGYLWEEYIHKWFKDYIP